VGLFDRAGGNSVLLTDANARENLQPRFGSPVKHPKAENIKDLDIIVRRHLKSPKNLVKQ
jgi:hypothetical protein